MPGYRELIYKVSKGFSGFGFMTLAEVDNANTRESNQTSEGNMTGTDSPGLLCNVKSGAEAPGFNTTGCCCCSRC